MAAHLHEAAVVETTLLKKTGERRLVSIAISLRTRDFSKARTIAAHLAVASDGILRQEGREVLSAVQSRSMLEAVARENLAKPDRLSALETAVGISADDGRATDRIALPRTYGKGQNDRKTPLSVRLERTKALPEKDVVREPGTLNRHLSQLQEVLVYIAACWPQEFRSFVPPVIVRPWATSSMINGSKFNRLRFRMPPKRVRSFIRLERLAGRI